MELRYFNLGFQFTFITFYKTRAASWNLINKHGLKGEIRTKKTSHAYREANCDFTTRHDTAAARLRGGRQRLPLHVLQGADGEGDPGAQVHRGWPVQQSPVRNQHPVRQGGRRQGECRHQGALELEGCVPHCTFWTTKQIQGQFDTSSNFSPQVFFCGFTYES